MSRTTDATWYWEHRGRYPTGMWTLQLTRRERQHALKAQRHGRRMRPQIKRKPKLYTYDAASVRIFMNGVELTNFINVEIQQHKHAPKAPIIYTASFDINYLPPTGATGSSRTGEP